MVMLGNHGVAFILKRFLLPKDSRKQSKLDRSRSLIPGSLIYCVLSDFLQKPEMISSANRTTTEQFFIT